MTKQSVTRYWVKGLDSEALRMVVLLQTNGSDESSDVENNWCIPWQDSKDHANRLLEYHSQHALVIAGEKVAHNFGDHAGTFHNELDTSLATELRANLSDHGIDKFIFCVVVRSRRLCSVLLCARLVPTPTSCQMPFLRFPLRKKHVRRWQLVQSGLHFQLCFHVHRMSLVWQRSFHQLSKRNWCQLMCIHR